jgi:hypothetical protein
MNRNFLLKWLIESEPLLHDELDHGKLRRMTVVELYRVAEIRQRKLIESAEADRREADALEAYRSWRKLKGARKSGK